MKRAMCVLAIVAIVLLSLAQVSYAQCNTGPSVSAANLSAGCGSGGCNVQQQAVRAVPAQQPVLSLPPAPVVPSAFQGLQVPQAPMFDARNLPPIDRKSALAFSEPKKQVPPQSRVDVRLASLIKR